MTGLDRQRWCRDDGTATTPSVNSATSIKRTFALPQTVKIYDDDEADAPHVTKPPNTNLLWKGDVAGGHPHRYDRVTIVISHCSHDLDWVIPFVRGYEGTIVAIHVYSKCGRRHNVALPEDVTNVMVVSADLPNVGRCDHTFAYWMARHSAGLDDGEVVVFMKDSRDMHQLAQW
eukprot:CAMPEP_0172522916 /NCGR_PEP_ID=MMETSP1066-20121228/293381_1 /TAXON_ID=671091 /ORGANISM="Coscinodiscus wailesii, Strain CCMP2513" /LENGTH=173 /DNA_ID=CAMNT_0013305955 /DNA_START=189 /DNA_END=707 /DNA_ORIENTATION=-